MTPTPFAARRPDMAGARALVVGLGRSGLAAARLLAGRGARVTAADRRSEEELGGAVADLVAHGASVVTGGHPPHLAEETDLVVVSPGVPLELPLLEAARSRGLPVWGEVELAARFLEGRILGITGSNGKSTTTTMAGAILRAAGIPGGSGGNLGTPLTELLPVDGPDAVHAVELSSFQLDTVELFRAAVAVIVNLSPDHLDRHGSLEAYARAKARILDGQAPGDEAVLNADDPPSERFLPAVRGGLARFSVRGPVERGAWVRDGVIVLAIDGRDEPVMEAAALPVPGEHNLANALAAAAACRLAGCPPEAVAAGLRAFRALPHRLERVAEIGGIVFWNDSKATNLDATARALASFPPGTVHLILGGKDKGADWASLAPLAAERAARVLLVGEAAPAVRRALEGIVPLQDCGTVAAAVAAGLAGAQPGDAVLLAPGCASFDQYRNFEERGEDFRRAVAALGGSRA